MHRIMLYAAVCAGLPIQAALSQDIIPVNNVTIDMVRHGGKGSFRMAFIWRFFLQRQFSDRCKDIEPKRFRRI